MLFSIPEKYLEEIQDKLEIGLIIKYRCIHYEENIVNQDKIDGLYYKYAQGADITFSELANLDKTYLNVINDIADYAKNDFTAMINKANSEEDIEKIIINKKHSWTVQRKRWKKNETVRKKSRAVLEIINKDRTKDEWKEKYHCRTLNEYIAILEERVQEWDKKQDYFYKFPYFEYLTNNQKKNGLKHDIDINLFELFEKDKLVNFYISKPQYLSNTPIYTAKKEQIKMTQNEDGSLKAVKETGENTEGQNTKVTYYTIPNESIPGKIDEKAIMKTLDAMDNELVDYIMTHMGEHLYTDARATFSLFELAKNVMKKNGGSTIENVKKRLLNLVRPIKYSDGETDINLTLFDTCVITYGKVDKNSKVEQQIASVIPGRTITEAYIKNQLTYIVRKQYEELEQPLSKHLCYNLQRDRVGLASYNRPLTIEYNLLYFNQIIQFGTNDKQYKFNIIKNSLDEFVQKKFIVKGYEVTKKGFYVTFFPLSESEKKDLEKIRKIKENNIIDSKVKKI